MTKRTRSLLCCAALLAAGLGSAMAQDCTDYAATTRWVGEKAFVNRWRENPDGRYLASSGATIVAGDLYGGLAVFDASHPDDLRLLGWPGRLSDEMGITSIAISGSFVYMAQAGDSLMVISIANPAHPVCVGGFTPLPDHPIIACRDTWLYVAGGTTLSVFDVTNPPLPSLVAELALPAVAVDLAVSESLAVVATAAGLLTIDVSDPRAPRLRGICNDAGPGIAAVALQGSHAYLVNNDFIVVDLSDPAAPRCVGRAVLAGGLAVAVEGRWGVTTGLPWSCVKTLDLSDPTQPRLIGQTGPEMLQHCGVVLHDGYAFTPANDMGLAWLPGASLVAYRIGPAPPPPVTITHPWPESYGWNVFSYRMSVEGDYLHCLTFTWVNGVGTVKFVDVLELGAPGGPALVGSVRVHGDCIGWQGSRAYMAGNALELLDLSVPAQPRITATFPLPVAAAGKVQSVLVCDPLVLLVTEDPAVGVVAVDARDPAAPFVVASGPSPLVGKRTIVRGSVGYAVGNDSLYVLDLSDPARATVVRGFASGQDWDSRLAIANDHLWLVGSTEFIDNELRGYSLADPLAPVLVSRNRAPADGSQLTAAGDMLLIADVRGSFAMDVSDPSRPFCAGMVSEWAFDSLARWNDQVLAIGGGAILFAPLPCPAAVPVLLASFAVAAEEGGVGISWTAGVAAAGEFRLSAGAGGQTWAVPFTTASGAFVAQDRAPALAAGGAVGYTLEYRASAGEAWQVLARQSVELAAPARPVALLAARPNPFNPVVSIPFVLARAQRARVAVYDLAGRRVATLADQAFGAGRQELVWRGVDARGAAVASGSYVVRVEGEFGRDGRRITLIR